MFNNWKKSNACRFLNSYAWKRYEVHRLKTLFRGSNFEQTFGPSYKKRRQSKNHGNEKMRLQDTLKRANLEITNLKAKLKTDEKNHNDEIQKLQAQLNLTVKSTFRFFNQNFGLWQFKFFDKNLAIWLKFWFFEISILDQNISTELFSFLSNFFTFIQNFHFCPIFSLLSKIFIFVQIFRF